MADAVRLHAAMITLKGQEGQDGPEGEGQLAPSPQAPTGYLFGTVKCAFIVPAFVIHAPPPLPLSTATAISAMRFIDQISGA
jgi:hypothetical protein